MPTLLKPKPNDDVIVYLRERLAEAERGELRGVLCLGTMDNNTVSHGHAGEFTASKFMYAFELWKHRLFHLEHQPP